MSFPLFRVTACLVGLGSFAEAVQQNDNPDNLSRSPRDPTSVTGLTAQRQDHHRDPRQLPREAHHRDHRHDPKSHSPALPFFASAAGKEAGEDADDHAATLELGYEFLRLSAL
jgi:hypothetical protein